MAEFKAGTGWFLSVLGLIFKVLKLNIKTLNSVKLTESGNIVLMGPWTANAPLTIQGVTTNPIKASTTKIVDFIRSRVISDKEISVVGKYGHVGGVSGATNGSGDYLISLTSGVQFNSAIHPFYTTTTAPNSSVGLTYAIPGSLVKISVDIYEAVGVIIPYDATRFRIFIIKGDAEGLFFGSGAYQLGAYTNASFDFEFVFRSI